MSERSVIEHALTVYYDGNAKLAGQIIDLYRDFVAHELAEKIRDHQYLPPLSADEVAFNNILSGAARLIDPEVSDG